MRLLTFIFKIADKKRLPEYVFTDWAFRLRRRAGGPTDLSRCASQPKALIANADPFAKPFGDFPNNPFNRGE